MSFSESLVFAGSDDAAVGTISWGTPGNITAVDDAWATASLNVAEVSHYAKGLMSTPFAIPAGSVINGIEVELHKNRQAGIGAIRDSVVKLVKGGTVSGNNNADTATTWTGPSDFLKVYGSSSDLWGLSWTVADVNATDFGAVISATNAGGSADVARIDDMLIRVHYTVVTAALTGTIATSTQESHIVAGGRTLILTLTGDTWVTAGATFDAQRQNIINGIDSAQAEAAGWDAVVKAGLAVTDVVRTSDTVVTVTLPAFATYNITATETITATIPATALTGGSAVVATPTFHVSPISTTRMGHLGGLGIGRSPPPRVMATARRAIVPMGWGRKR